MKCSHIGFDHFPHPVQCKHIKLNLIIGPPTGSQRKNVELRMKIINLQHNFLYPLDTKMNGKQELGKRLIEQ